MNGWSRGPVLSKTAALRTTAAVLAAIVMAVALSLGGASSALAGSQPPRTVYLDALRSSGQDGSTFTIGWPGTCSPQTGLCTRGTRVTYYPEYPAGTYYCNYQGYKGYTSYAYEKPSSFNEDPYEGGVFAFDFSGLAPNGRYQLRWNVDTCNATAWLDFYQLSPVTGQSYDYLASLNTTNLHGYQNLGYVKADSSGEVEVKVTFDLSEPGGQYYGVAFDPFLITAS